jgi:excisionase family DNA binding protein
MTAQKNQERTTYMSDFLKVGEAHRLLSISRSAFYGLMDAGKIEYIKIGRSRRISRAALEEFVRKNTVPAR